jgi:DNA-binding response OmpR family regulator
MEAASDHLRSGDVEIRTSDGLVLVGGRVLPMSIRELRLLTALVAQEGRIVSREDLYRLAWDAPLRNGDRSVDVYVHKLRVKLEDALPGHSFIHTHFGFGYRFAPEPSHAFHKSATRR